MIDAIPFLEPAASVRYALTHRPVADDRVDIVLDLFRGGLPVLTRTVAQVERVQAVLVMVKCRRYLDLRGVTAAGPVAPSSAPAKAAAAPVLAAPVPAKAVVPPMQAASVPARVVPTRAAVTSARPVAVPAQAAAVSAKAMPAPVQAAAAPAKLATVAARPMAAPVKAAAIPMKPRRERAPEARPAAPAAAFDWMFQAV